MKQSGLRIGLLLPINNTTMERELLAWLPESSTCSTLRIARGKATLTPADLPAYVALAMTMAKTFDSESVDLVVYGCTAAGFMAGSSRDAEIAAELSALTGKPVVTTASAMIGALRHLGTRNIALISPYLDHVNERLEAFLEQSGIGVEILAGFHAQSTDELAAITPAQIAALARKTMRASCDGLFIACSQLPTREILGDLEREFGRPVWSSVKATAWQARRAGEAAPDFVRRDRNLTDLSQIT